MTIEFEQTPVKKTCFFKDTVDVPATPEPNSYELRPQFTPLYDGDTTEATSLKLKHYEVYFDKGGTPQGAELYNTKEVQEYPEPLEQNILYWTRATILETRVLDGETFTLNQDGSSTLGVLVYVNNFMVDNGGKITVIAVAEEV